MDDSKSAYGWRKGYPPEEMIAAHSSGWWLFKRKNNETIYFSTMNLSPNLVSDIEFLYYYNEFRDKFIVNPTSFENPSAHDGMYKKYQFCLDKDGSINIYGPYSIVDNEPYFKGKLEGGSVKQIKSDEDADYLWHAEIILNRIREELRGEERKNNRMYADCYFCPIDEDGNKVPWPSSDKKEEE